MAKQKYYYYVLVFRDEPLYVTSIDYSDKTSQWDRLGKPLEMSKDRATDLVFGLSLNFFSAVVVTSLYPLETQPYHYERGYLKWTEGEKPKDE